MGVVRVTQFSVTIRRKNHPYENVIHLSRHSRLLAPELSITKKTEQYNLASTHDVGCYVF